MASEVPGLCERCGERAATDQYDARTPAERDAWLCRRCWERAEAAVQ
jgi:hypothetical protein